MSDLPAIHYKTKYHLLIENMVSGFAYHKIICDSEGKPIDYEFLAVNKTFEKFTGLRGTDILGKKVTEVHPGIENLEFDWIGGYGKVALTGESIAFEQYFVPQQHWYFISAYCPQKGFFVVTFENITALKKVEVTLHRTNNELECKTVELEDTNTALKILLKKGDQDNLELRENIHSNYEIMIKPFLDKLKNRLNNRNQQNLLDIIDTNLREIVAPFAKNLSNPMMSLTSSEIQIAIMIKQGYSNKEIATILNSSKRTIDTHRQNIRRKLQLKNKKINLKTYLMNL